MGDIECIESWEKAFCILAIDAFYLRAPHFAKL